MVRLWDVVDRSGPVRVGEPLTGHTGWVLSVALAADGRTLATGSEDGTVLLWDIGTFLGLRDQAIALACSYTDGGFNQQDWARYVPGLPYQASCPAH